MKRGFFGAIVDRVNMRRLRQSEPFTLLNKLHIADKTLGSGNEHDGFVPLDRLHKILKFLSL